MKTIVSTLSVCLVVVCVAGSLALVDGFRSNRELREINQNLEAELRAARARTDALLDEKEETGKQVTLLREVAEGFQARMAENAENAEKGTDDAVPTLTPYQTPAFLGQKFIGQAWIVPRNLRKDTNTQSYVYEQVVWLDERLLENVLARQNATEQVVENPTYVNNTYYPQPYYYAGYPINYGHRTNQFSSKLQPSPAPTTPPRLLPPVAPRVSPGVGAVSLRQLDIPVGQNRTRPQLPTRQPPSPPRRSPPGADGTRTTIP